MTAIRPLRSLHRPALVAAVCLLVSIVLGGPALKLTDGRTIKGVDLRSEGDLYMLVVAGGNVIPVPKAAVASVTWIEDQPGSGGSGAVANMVTGKTDEERQQDAAHRAARAAEAEAAAAEQRAEADRQEAERSRSAGNQPRGPAYETDPQGIRHWNQGVTLAGQDIRPPSPQEQLAVFGEPAQFAQDVVEFDLHPTYWVPDPEDAMGMQVEYMAPPRNDTWVPTDGFKK